MVEFEVSVYAETAKLREVSVSCVYVWLNVVCLEMIFVVVIGP